MIKKLLLCAALLLTPVTASARDTVTDDGNELLQTCDDTGYYMQGLCLGLVRGTEATLDEWATANSASPYCRPANVTVGQIRDLVISYIRSTPESRNEPRSLLMIKAQKAAWPCK